jgi:hypothetical protein
MMMPESWNNPHVQEAATQIAKQIIQGQPNPQISDAHNLNNDQRAMAFYIGRSLVRISRMVKTNTDN